MKNLMTALLLGLLVLASSPADAAKEELTVEEQYELGQRYLKRGYYTKAIEQFNRIRNFYRDDPYSIKAELAIADVYFEQNEWDQARLAYDDFMRMHPRHPELDYVVYRMGLTLYKKAPKVAGRDQTWTRQAVNTWSGFDARFPESGYRDEVMDKLDESRERLAKKELLIAKFYAQRRAWKAVLGRVDDLLRVYPNSEHVGDALLLKALAHAGQGEVDMANLTATRLLEVDPRLAHKLERKRKKVESRRERELKKKER